MHINYIKFKQHAVLGNTTIQFVRDAELKGMDKHLDMSISMGESGLNTMLVPKIRQLNNNFYLYVA